MTNNPFTRRPIADGKGNQARYVSIGKTYVSDCCKGYPQAIIETATIGGKCIKFYKCAECGKPCDPVREEPQAQWRFTCPHCGRDMPEAEKLNHTCHGVNRSARFVPITAVLEKALGKKQPPSARDFVRKERPESVDALRQKWMEEGARLALESLLERAEYHGAMVSIGQLRYRLDNRDYGFPVDDR